MRFYAIFLALIFVMSPAFGDQVHDIRLGTHPDKTRIVMDIDGAMDFHATLQKNPDQLVIHLPFKQWAVSGDTNIVAPFSYIRHEKTSANLTKITLGLTRPVAIDNAFIMPADQTHPYHRLVMDIGFTSMVMFDNAINRPFGTMTLPTASDASLDDLINSIAGTEKTTLPVPQNKPEATKKRPRHKPIIVIDAGHGGKDPGAVSPGGIREKDITLPLAKMVAQTLNQSGLYDARLTRTTDVYIKLHNRVKIARTADADLFISIHADSVRNHKTRGASIYTLSDKASDAQTARLAARENRSDLIAGVDLGVEDEDVTMILLDLSMRDTMNRSKYLANTIVDNFGPSGVPTLQGPHRYAGFAVLKAPDVPSVLIETGFVSNESEARKLKTPAFQKQIASAVLKSLNHYFDIK